MQIQAQDLTNTYEEPLDTRGCKALLASMLRNEEALARGKGFVHVVWDKQRTGYAYKKHVTRQRYRARLEAFDFFFDDADNRILPFTYICRVLGLNETIVRSKIIEKSPDFYRHWLTLRGKDV